MRCVEGEISDEEAFYYDPIWGWVHKAKDGWHTLTGTPLTERPPGPEGVNEPLTVLLE